MTKTMKAIDFLKWNRDETHCCPQSREGRCVGLPSNGELRRWLQKGSVLINGNRVGPGDVVRWPITQLVFFSETKSQVTLMDDEVDERLWFPPEIYGNPPINGRLPRLWKNGKIIRA